MERFLKFISRAIIEFFRFCFVLIISYLLIAFGLYLKAKGYNSDPNGGSVMCPVTCFMAENFNKSYLTIGSLWLLFTAFFFRFKKWAWGIDFLIVSLLILFVMPFIFMGH